jgi:succinate dehydrogenase / fumarate reductase iron-sulfur subunit
MHQAERRFFNEFYVLDLLMVGGRATGVVAFLVTNGHEPTRERIQSQADRDRFDDSTKYILCAACTTSCPVFWSDGQYFGPQAIVGAHRFIPRGIEVTKAIQEVKRALIFRRL